ncbi:ABC-type multidrug transport system fused ATPase/permease subunit [Dysgonomonas sp. PH5-45]|uniref:hypothetical protein n=1 Tax=unclassified Dysgonomonas TaxID=2630389 RepID=UPI002473799C|nr:MULTISPECIES: hypothetical protein [unclassified Dysgonomonas]MDH6354509.1 ABC-type multidrug transport system fused ATPase/permease subunit [Dysgonomonas sp. PH5-45]MDH6387434.1 ABC-type multidrug transport system fused ATPase/permease subunit [Dysgonomonas sp. PH5-37]
MKKSNSNKTFAICLLAVWAVITAVLFIGLFLEYAFVARFIVPFLLLVFLVLLGVYARRLWRACTKEGETLKRLNGELDSALRQMRRLQTETKQKELVWSQLLGLRKDFPEKA